MVVSANRPSDSTLATWPHTQECLGSVTMSFCPTSCLPPGLSSPHGECLPLAHIQGPEMATAQPPVLGALRSGW